MYLQHKVFDFLESLNILRILVVYFFPTFGQFIKSENVAFVSLNYSKTDKTSFNQTLPLKSKKQQLELIKLLTCEICFSQ